ncbi:sodium:solute symporter family protein [Victivallis lenta]|uniref:sodium:solute symporter family protein n=1 Tax=Victivallis lenta TaxID=2606640 RepID=UPI00235660C4|nr:sodium:solute symporter family protein [Victivallis lenta]
MTPPLLLAAADSGSGMNTWVLGTLIAVYLGIIGCLGYRGFRRTASNKDYLLAGRSVNPFVMAMSYGAAFISTSALVGFGGIAGQFGMGLMWLVFMNIAIGIVVAFIFFGPRTRRIGLALDAHTFPEFMGNRFESNYLKVFLAAIIFLFMPLYSSVVLIGGARFLQEVMMIDYGWALAVFALVVAVYVVFGGLKGVMYVDAMMGTVMIAGMLSLLVMCYWKLGGVASAHQALTDMAPLVAERLPKEAALGHQGWTAMPKFNSVWWWTLVSSLMLGVGIGALAQPQLAVRFMTVKSTRELNRAVVIGSVFILCTAGAAYMVGALSNVFFYHADKGIAEGISGKLAIEAAGGNPDLIIPLFIRQALPPVILYIFSLTLLSAAMSTLSSLFHVTGSAIGHDLFRNLSSVKRDSVLITRLGVIFGIAVSVVLGIILPPGIIARGTAIFFGVCAAAFLPSYCAAIYWRGATRFGVWLSISVGVGVSLFGLVFLHSKESAALGICRALFGRNELVSEFPWPYVDTLVYSLPLSFFALVIGSWCSAKPSPAHIKNCFESYKIDG